MWAICDGGGNWPRAVWQDKVTIERLDTGYAQHNKRYVKTMRYAGTQ